MIVSVFTLVGVLAVTLVLFGFWITATIFKLIWGLIPGANRRNLPAANNRHCNNPGCRTINPLHARFCRRCGSNLSELAYNQRSFTGRQVVSV